MSQPDPRHIAAIAHGIRRRVLEHTLQNNGGYMSQACSAAELLATCYGGAVNLGPVAAPVVPPPFDRVPAPGAELVTGAVVHGEPAADRDRFIVSPAHYALVVYAALIEARRLDEVAMDNFNQDGSTVELIGRNFDGTWVRVTYETEGTVLEGWVATQYLTVTRGGQAYDVMELPDVGEAPVDVTPAEGAPADEAPAEEPTPTLEPAQG